MKRYSIHKIGGMGLMLPYEHLKILFKYILNSKGENTQTIVVVSAFAMITRHLEEIFNLKMSDNSINSMLLFEKVKKLHLKRCSDLLIKDTSKIFEYFHEIEYFIYHSSINEKNPTISKAILLRLGELMSSEIINQFLLKENISTELIDAQNVIFATGGDYCNSTPLQPETSEAISKVITNDHSSIILTQGYIANHRLLGLDGSDLTAGLISFGLELCVPHCKTELTFWKDVNGVIVKGKIKEKISFGEYILLETVPVRKDAIMVNERYEPETRIRSFINLENPGTIISWR